MSAKLIKIRRNILLNDILAELSYRTMKLMLEKIAHSVCTKGPGIAVINL